MPRDSVDQQQYEQEVLLKAKFNINPKFRPLLDKNIFIMDKADWAVIKGHFDRLNIHFDEKVYLKDILNAIQNDPNLRDVRLMPAVHLFGKKRKLTLQRVLRHLATLLPS